MRQISWAYPDSAGACHDVRRVIHHHSSVSTATSVIRAFQNSGVLGIHRWGSGMGAARCRVRRDDRLHRSAPLGDG